MFSIQKLAEIAELDLVEFYDDSREHVKVIANLNTKRTQKMKQAQILTNTSWKSVISNNIGRKKSTLIASETSVRQIF